MPKKFTDFERNMIHLQLLDVGKRLFETQGFHKTSIDQLVYEVGIAKGSFYKFFDNKETLFYYILEGIEVRLHEDMVKHFHLKDQNFIEAFKELFKYQLNFIRSEPLFQSSMDTQFMASVWSKLPERVQMRSHQVDMDKMKDLRSLAQDHNYDMPFDDTTLSGIVRSLAFVLIHDEIMGTGASQVIDFYIDEIIDGLFKPVHDSPSYS